MSSQAGRRPYVERKVKSTGVRHGLRLRRKKKDSGSNSRGLSLRDGQRREMSDAAEGAASIGRRTVAVRVQRGSAHGQKNRDQAQQNEKIPENLRAFEMALAEQVHRLIGWSLLGVELQLAQMILSHRLRSSDIHI